MSAKTKEVGAFEAKTHLSALLDQVEAGVTIYISRHGQRIAELRPIVAPKRPIFGSASGRNFAMRDDFDAPLDDFAEYER